MCDPSVPLLYWPFAPYVDRISNQTYALEGVVYTIFKESYLTCCNRSENARTIKLHTQAAMLVEIESMQRAFAMPVLVSHLAINTVPEVFIRVFDHPGLSLVTHPIENTTNVLLSGIQNVWPLLAAFLIISGYFSLIFWLAEFETKNRAFAARFRSGFFEAFWYSLVSATTVGYGDKVPNSRTGKFFGIVWILGGICVSGAFTAAITTLMSQMQSGLLEDVVIGNNARIGVLNGTIDQYLVALAGANPVPGNHLQDLAMMLHKSNKNESTRVAAVAIDPNHLRTFGGDYFADDYVTMPRMSGPVGVGYLLKTTTDLATLRCFRQQAFFRQLQVNDLLKVFSVDTAHRVEDKSEVAAKSIVRDADVKLLLYTAVLLVLIFVVISIAEVLFEKIKGSGNGNNRGSQSNGRSHEEAQESLKDTGDAAF